MKNRPKTLTSSGRKALLLDLENLVWRGSGADAHLIPAADVFRRLQQVLTRAGSVHYILAVASPWCIRRYGTELAALGIRWSTCQPGPDAADKALCLIASDLVEHGYTSLAIASGDHFFACLAAIASITVVVPDNVAVSSTLRSHCLSTAA